MSKIFKAKTAGPIIISLLTLLVYLPALKNGFVNWDDPVYVYKNQYIRSLDFSFLTIAFSTGFVGHWHPLTMISYAFDYSIWGLNPLGYHLTNILIHSLNTFLVFILARRLIGVSANGHQQTMHFSLIASSLTAVLFGIHPLHVESVAWISERKDVLCAFFYLLSLITYIVYASSKARKRNYTSSIIYFILALLSKPMAVSLPVVLLILDYYPFGRLSMADGARSIKRSLVEKIPFFFIAILLSIITIVFQQNAIKTAEEYAIIGRSFIALGSYIFYIFKMALPFSLAPFYPYPDTVDFLSLESVFPVILFIALSIIVVRLSRVSSLFPAIWVYYLISLFPVIGIIRVGEQAAADRYTYLPSLGPFLLAGLAAGYIFERYSRKLCLILIGVILILLESATVRQIAIWHDPISLWSHEIKLQPQAYLPYILRAEIYHRIGNYKAAIMDYTTAIKINPGKAEAYNDRATSYTRLGNHEAALSDRNIFINLNPEFALGYYNRGVLYYIQGNHPLAIVDYSKAIALDPKLINAYNARGLAYYALGKYREALQDFDKIIEFEPENEAAYNNRKNILNMLDSSQYSSNGKKLE